MPWDATDKQGFTMSSIQKQVKGVSLCIALLLSLTTQVHAEVIVTASSVSALQQSLTSIQPPVVTPDNPEDYLSVTSALGYSGPIGPLGPLSVLGPVGNNTWNPSTYISGLGNWSLWATQLSQLSGPLSANGPLGDQGPLTATSYYQLLPSINDFAKQTQAGGVWGILGPLGP